MAGRLRIGVLASGGGTNLQAIIDACKSGRINGDVVVVIGDVECGALDRAKKAGIAAIWIDRREKNRFPDREAFDRAIVEELRAHQVGLVCLAGYLRIMTHELADAYAGRMMNIHPALLPSFGGKGMWGHHVHQAVLDYGCKVSGCTVHFVSLETDGGPIILQRGGGRGRRHPGDTGGADSALRARNLRGSRLAVRRRSGEDRGAASAHPVPRSA